MPNPVMHGGCKGCGAKDEPVLKATTAPHLMAKFGQGAQGTSIALCSKCLATPRDA